MRVLVERYWCAVLGSLNVTVAVIKESPDSVSANDTLLGETPNIDPNSSAVVFPGTDRTRNVVADIFVGTG